MFKIEVAAKANFKIGMYLFVWLVLISPVKQFKTSTHTQSETGITGLRNRTIQYIQGLYTKRHTQLISQIGAIDVCNWCQGKPGSRCLRTVLCRLFGGQTKAG